MAETTHAIPDSRLEAMDHLCGRVRRRFLAESAWACCCMAVTTLAQVVVNYSA